MKTLLGFIKKEFRQTLRDPRMRMLLFIAPCVQLTIFGVALSTEAKNIRLAIFASPDDTTIHELHRKALASGWFIPAKVTKTDPFEQVQSGEADAVLMNGDGLGSHHVRNVHWYPSKIYDPCRQGSWFAALWGW